MEFRSDRQFDSLDECLAHLRTEYAQRESYIEARTSAGLYVPLPVPRFLFRGECGAWPSTECSLQRAKQLGTLGFAETEVLDKLYNALLWRFTQEDYTQKPYINAAWDAESCLQHYGFPTRVIVFTSEVDVAAAFAAREVTRFARICVLKNVVSPHAATARFTDHDWDDRPRRQAAYGVRHLSVSDLKSRAACDQMGILWFEFPVSVHDHDFWYANYRRLNEVNRDPGAGILRSEINSYVAGFGKIPHRLAEWLVDRIPMVPRYFENHSLDSTGSYRNVWPVAATEDVDEEN